MKKTAAWTVVIGILLSFVLGLTASAYEYDSDSNTLIMGKSTEKWTQNNTISYACSGYDCIYESLVIAENIERLEGELLNFCSSLTDIQLHEGIRVISANCFDSTAYYLDGRNWEIPGVLYIGDCLIRALPDKIGTEYEIRPGTRLIADGAFADCASLESVTIPDSVRFVGTGAFEGTALLADGMREDGVLYIDNVLVDCDESVSGDLVIRDGTRVLADSVFRDNTRITSVVCPSSVRYIGQYAFSGCTDLRSVSLGLTEVLGDMPFSGCAQLTVIEVDAENSVYSVNEGILYSKDCTKVLRCPEGMEGDVIMSTAAIEIAKGAFAGCSRIGTVRFSEGLLCIGNYAFRNSSIGLASLPPKLEYIGSDAFRECHRIAEISLPETVECLGGGAFYGCRDLQKVVVYDRIGVLEWSVFAECPKLIDVEILHKNGFDLTYIADNAFLNTPYLQNVSQYRDGMLIEADRYLILADSNMSVVRIPDSVVCVAEGAFNRENSRIQKIVIPDTVTNGYSVIRNLEKNVAVRYLGRASDLGDLYRISDSIQLYTDEFVIAAGCFVGLLMLAIITVIGTQIGGHILEKKYPERYKEPEVPEEWEDTEDGE